MSAHVGHSQRLRLSQSYQRRLAVVFSSATYITLTQHINADGIAPQFFAANFIARPRGIACRCGAQQLATCRHHV